MDTVQMYMDNFNQTSCLDLQLAYKIGNILGAG